MLDCSWAFKSCSAPCKPISQDDVREPATAQTAAKVVERKLCFMVCPSYVVVYLEPRSIWMKSIAMARFVISFGSSRVTRIVTKTSCRNRSLDDS